jgi:hypothetical protein
MKPSWNVSTPPLFEGCECQIAPVMPDPSGRMAGGRGGETREAMDPTDAIARMLAMQAETSRMNAEALRSLGQIVETLRVRGPEIRFDVDHMTQTHAPEITVAGPDMQPVAEAVERAIGRVGEAIGELELPAPTVEVKPAIRVEPAAPASVTVVQSFPKRTKERQKIVRDELRQMTEIEGETEYFAE